jgi:hypothetical protein
MISADRIALLIAITIGTLVSFVACFTTGYLASTFFGNALERVGVFINPESVYECTMLGFCLMISGVALYFLVHALTVIWQAVAHKGV